MRLAMTGATGFLGRELAHQLRDAGTVDGHPFTGAFMALGDGTHKLPVAAPIRTALGKSDGNDVQIHLTKRLN